MKEDIEEAKIPLLDHLVELRQRLLYSLVGFLVCFFLAFYFAAEIFNPNLRSPINASPEFFNNILLFVDINLQGLLNYN